MQDITVHNNPCVSGGAFWHSTDDFTILWKDCIRSDWFLWILENGKYPDDRKLRKFACECVRYTPFGDKAAWDTLTVRETKNVVIYTEQYLDGTCSKDDLKNGELVAWAVPVSKNKIELVVPIVANLDTKAIDVAKYVSWEMALLSKDLRRGLKYQADLLRDIIGFEAMAKCGKYIKDKE